MSDKIVDEPEPPRAPEGGYLPTNCITSDALVALASAMDWLADMHNSMKGLPRDAPCLRRIEAGTDGRVDAHISTGPAVGGSWVRLTLRNGVWEMS